MPVASSLGNPVPLDNPIIVQQEISSSSVEILEVVENYTQRTVKVSVKLSDAPISLDNFLLWGPDQYNIDWTQADLESAIADHYNSI
jgi:hypothetical protein